MTIHVLRLAGIIVLFLVCAHSSHGQPPLGLRTDRYGDALPEGAVARLGTLRLTHLGGIEAVAISPDGMVAASGVRDGKVTYLGERTVHQSKGFSLGEGVSVTEATIRLWNVKTGELIRQFSTPDAPVTHIRFASDGKTFFAGCGKFLCCWESNTGKKLWQQEAILGGRFHYGVHLNEIIQAGETIASLHSGRILCPVESNGGASYHYHPQRVIRFWNAKTGVPLPLPKALQSTIHAQTRVPILLHNVALTPDLKRAAIAVSEAEPLPRNRAQDSFRDVNWKYPNSRVEIIDLASSKALLSIANPDGEFGELAISADGSKVATLTGKTIETPFDKDGRTGTSIDTRKDLWFAKVGDTKKQILAKELVGIHHLAFVGTDRLATNDYESKVSVWRLDTGARVEKHDIRPEVFAPGSAAGVAVEPWNNTVRLIDVKTGKLLHTFDGHRSAPSLRFAIHSKDTLISRDGELAIFWDSRLWKTSQSIPMPKDEVRWFRWGRNADAEFDHDLCVEKGLYLHKSKGGLELRDIISGKTVRQIDRKGEHDRYYFSSAGNRLMCQEDGTYCFFDVETGKRLSKLAGESRNVRYFWYRHPEMSTHGKYFARTATDERTAIELYDVDSGKLLRKLTPKFVGLKEQSGSILKFKFSSDEQLVFGEVHEQGSFENGFSGERVSISIWRTDTGEVLQDLVVEPAMNVFWRETLSRSLVGVMAISPDRRFVALARTYGRAYERRLESTPIEIWEVASGEKRGELKGHGPIADLAFSPDGRCLASSSDDTTILIWDLNRSLQPRKKSATKLTGKDLDDAWRALFERDPARADIAIWNLIECPDDSLAYLRKKLQPSPIPDPDRVQRLLADIDNGNFQTRMRADAELEKLGELILTQLDRAIKKADSLESRRRLESLAFRARQASRPFATLTRIGEWRALEVVEKIGQPRAVEILRDLANGSPEAQLTIAARAALMRAEARSKTTR